jgi:hypothetical protein
VVAEAPLIRVGISPNLRFFARSKAFAKLEEQTLKMRVPFIIIKSVQLAEGDKTLVIISDALYCVPVYIMIYIE